MKFFLKNKLAILICLSVLLLSPLLGVNAAIFNDETKGGIILNSYNAAVGDGGGFDAMTTSYTASEIVATVIKAFLGLLGVIFIFLVVIAGYKYMTANGDEGQVEDALGSIRTAIIGLIIVVSAYAITAFVFKNISTDGSGGATPTTVSP